MKILGITAEYNPFHMGHKYHIEKSKSITKADVCAVVMSGNFVQRGAPSVCDKWIRAAWAVENGADIVFELPAVFALSSAQHFAFGAISLLDSIKSDYISFGAENTLEEIINAYNVYKTKENEMNFSNEMPFHRARTKLDSSLEILNLPNNILAFEYIKALDNLKSKSIPLAIKRKDKGYSSLDIDEFSSATAIRNAILNKDSISGTVDEKIKSYFDENNMVTEDNFLNLIKYSMLTKSKENLSSVSEIREGIENKIVSVVKENNFSNFDELVKLIKSKRYTYTAISRMLFQILLDIKKDDVLCPPSYLRVLGFNSKGRKLLKEIKNTVSVPIITKPSEYSDLTEQGIKMLEKDFLATDIYNLALNKKGKVDLTTSPIIIS